MLKCAVKFLLKCLLVFLVIILIPGLPPKTTFPFEEFSVVKPKAFKDTNNALNNAERWYEGKLLGPEHLLAKGKFIYATLGTGEVVRLDGENVTHVIRFGEPCQKFHDPHCGRPLGVAFDTISDRLIVSDSYFGIYEVNLRSFSKRRLISPEDIIDGPVPRRAKLFNSVAIAKNGDIYWTDSSSDFSLSEWSYEGLINPSGRLIHYSRATLKNTVILDKLWFANGVALPNHEEFIVAVELMASRLQKCYLKGEKKGKCEIFIEGLPGIADNLTPDEEGIWVPLLTSFDENHPFLFHSMAKLPNLRKFLVRVIWLLKLPFQLIQNVLPNLYTEWVIEQIQGLAFRFVSGSSRTTIIKLNWDGKIIKVLHGSDQTVHTISHVLQLEDQLYLGSPFNDFIGKIKIEMS